MIINLAKLKTIRVETQNGEFLGTILDVELDIATGLVAKYAVGYDFMIMKQINYLIAPNQVIRMNGETMIVEDNIEKVKTTKSVEKPTLIKEESPTLNAEIK